MSNKLFFGSLAGAALVATTLANVPTSQAAPLQAAAAVGSTISFGTSIGGESTSGANISVTTAPGSAATGITSTSTPTELSTQLTGTATTANGLESSGAASSKLTFGPEGIKTDAGAGAANNGGQGASNAATNTNSVSIPGLQLSGGGAAGTYGTITSGF